MKNSFLQFDVQSIILIVCLLISGLSIGKYLLDGNIGLLFTFIGTTLVGYALAYDLYRKRKKAN